MLGTRIEQIRMLTAVTDGLGLRIPAAGYANKWYWDEPAIADHGLCSRSVEQWCDLLPAIVDSNLNAGGEISEIVHHRHVLR